MVANCNPKYFVHKLIAKWTCHSLILTMFGKNVLYNWMNSVVLVPITGLAEVVDQNPNCSPHEISLRALVLTRRWAEVGYKTIVIRL